jgi:LruC domain-containing protein
MKNFNSLLLGSLLVIFGSCEPNEIELQNETGSLGDISSVNADDVASLIVPEGHDLRAISLQNTNIRLSENSRADAAKVRIYKIDNDVQKLLYQGSIDRANSINNLIMIPNHTSLISVQADLAMSTREWIISPAELDNLIIEDDPEIGFDDDDDFSSNNAGSKSSGNNPPTWNCNHYQEFSGNDDGDFKITSNSTQGMNVSENTSIYICSGASWNPASLTDWESKLTIYVASGASLSLNGALYSTIYNEGTFNGVNTIFRNKSEFDNWGTTNINGNLGVFSDNINIYGGTCNISGSLQIEGHFDNEGGTVNVDGSVAISDKLHNKEESTLSVGGNFTVNNGEFKNYCKTIISGNFVNSKKVEFKNASYTAITGSFTSNPDTDIKIKEGSIFKSASITSGGNIIGDHSYSIIETGSITFWSPSKKFKGELDICSDSYASSMGDNDVINTCTTFISSNSCSSGYNNVVDNDNDGSPEGVDVDDTNANVATYNFPQGQDSFFTTLYEDLYPCMGDYDLNDFVHNYTYREGINNGANNDGQNTYITEIKFDYKFPALGAVFNNSFVLRVMDGDNNATINLVNSDQYSINEITREHDTENNTTLFIFNNIKSIYTDNIGAFVNTDQIDYSDIPVISGTVSHINGAYDEFILKDGELGQEIHALYNELHINYRELNLPSMFFDEDNYLLCDDHSSGINGLFMNANGFPWVINDLPMELPWPKSGISIIEAYPNFDDFARILPDLDWYSDINGNRVEENMIIID